MAPMSPVSPVSPESTQSLKRKSATPADGEEEEHARKRFRSESTLETDAPEEEWKRSQVKVDLFDETPRGLLTRSVALALNAVGFDDASKISIEALASEAEAYLENLLSHITTSMLNGRRTQPIPLDYEYALAKFNLTSEHLEPHLEPPVPLERRRIRMEAPSPEPKMSSHLVDKLIGDDLSGRSDKEAKAYIPPHLPPFPSKHTYKFTEKDSTRVTDTRKIREEASHQARQGEDALRRLTAIGKIGKEKGAKVTAGKAEKSKERYKLWEEAQDPVMLSPPQEGQEIERSAVVNASSVYHRKGAPRTKKGAPQVPPELFGAN